MSTMDSVVRCAVTKNRVANRNIFLRMNNISIKLKLIFFTSIIVFDNFLFNFIYLKKVNSLVLRIEGHRKERKVIFERHPFSGAELQKYSWQHRPRPTGISPRPSMDSNGRQICDLGTDVSQRRFDFRRWASVNEMNIYGKFRKLAVFHFSH